MSQPIKSPLKSRLDLCRLFAEKGYKRGAEIGVWQGAFSERICQANPGVSLLCVDPWKTYADYNEKKNNQTRLNEAYLVAQQRLAPYGCELMKATSLKAASMVPDGSLDFVYIDGNHRRPFIDQDLAAWSPKVRSGGIVSGHDYRLNDSKSWIEVKPAVDEFTKAHGITEWFVIYGDKSPSYYWVKA